jgi:hypothetical protein
MFFQTSALTGGMTKKGEMIMMRTMPCARHRLVEQQREQRAADDGDEQHRADEHSVLPIAAKKAGSV